MLRAIARGTVYLLVTLVLLPVQMAGVWLKLGYRKRLPHIYHRICTRLLGFRVQTRGRMSEARPTLFVANHVSYLDIVMMGGAIPASFVAKAEIAKWPVLGLLAKLQRTVFVDRQRRSVTEHRDAMQKRLDEGDSLILFPEGTSADATHLRPFKSALLSVAEREAEGRPLTVQPVSIAYTALDGMPMLRAMRPIYAWYGDMTLAGHIWHALGAGRCRVVITFHPTVTLADAGTRRHLTRIVQERVSMGVEDARRAAALVPA